MRYGMAVVVLVASLACSGKASAQINGPQATCTTRKLAEIPITLASRLPTAPIKVNGIMLPFTLDTAAQYSSIYAGAARQLKLRIQDRADLIGRSAHGEVRLESVPVETFVFAGFSYKNFSLLIDSKEDDPDNKGLLGNNFLALNDIEYDLNRATVRTFKSEGCYKADLAYWAPGKAAVLNLPSLSGTWGAGRRPLPIVDGLLNGQPVKIYLNTASGPSRVSFAMAEKLGVKRDSPSVKYYREASGHTTHLQQASFEQLTIGFEEIHDPSFIIDDAHTFGVDVVLGTDFFLSHRIYFSYSQNKIYITYNGGPVFYASGAQEYVTMPYGPIADSDVKPNSADEFFRLALVAAARNASQDAIDNYSKAIELAPQEAQYFRGRAFQEEAARQLDAAERDLTHAVDSSPGDGDSLISRAQFYIDEKQPEKAKADIDKAASTLARDPRLGPYIISFYDAIEYYEDALTVSDAWILANPHDPQLLGIRADRCWNRALLKRDLDGALADCDAALKAMPGHGPELDSRALVHLDRGEYDLAIVDYDKALEDRPKQAWSLYGRGLAKLKKGLASEGEADIQAAKTASPTAVDQAERYGFKP